MTYKRGFGLLMLLIALSVSTISFAAGLTIDETIPPGNNFDKAEFRLWLPGGVSAVRAVVILVPGSNGDGRPMTAEAEWQDFATKNRLALVWALTDKPHEQSFIELSRYVNVSQGSGQALLTALALLRTAPNIRNWHLRPCYCGGFGGRRIQLRIRRREARARAGVCREQGRDLSHRSASQAARSVPGILFIGGKDLDSRIHIITGIFDVNRRAGALWALAEEPALRTLSDGPSM